MGNFDAANVIQAAATSNLGVISLLVLVLAFLAWRFFQRSDDKVKLIAFAMMFLGAAGFVSAVMLAGVGDGEGLGEAAEPTGAEPADPPSANAASSAEPGEAGAVPDIAGDWRDSDGYRFVFVQDGDVFTYKTFRDGEEVGWGAGKIAGTRLTYRFTDTANGNEGRCEADIAADARTIRGTCGDGSSEWDFAIRR